jgi:hypothetical protein
LRAADVTRKAVLLVLAFGGLIAPAVRGQATTVRDSAVRLRPDGSILMPVVFTYMATLTQGADTRSLGERSVQTRKTQYAGLPAWELVETRGTGANAAVDTLVVDFSSLAPLHWGTSMPLVGSTSQSAARISAEFRGDTIIGVLSSPVGRRNLVTSVPAGAYITPAQLEAGLRSMPLAIGVRDSVSMVATDVARMTSVTAEVAVIGEERLTTGAGSFDCWVVTISADRGSSTYWISKTDQVIAKVMQIVPESGDVLTYQLMSISH